MDSNYRTYRHSSFFFPIALITVGVVWLLVNNGTIAIGNVYRLAPFWPVLIILAGLSLLFRRSWVINLLIWGGAAALTLWLLTSGAAYLPETPSLDVKHETFTEPIGSARSAQVRLNLSINHTDINVMNASDDLVTADVYYTGEMNLRSTGGTEKTVRLVKESDSQPFNFNPRIDQWAALAEKKWEIGLTPSIPLQLTVDASTGSLSMDLAGLQLENLDVQGSTGSIDLFLPAAKTGYPVRLDASTGSLDVSVPAATAVDFDIEASTGSIEIDVPDDAGVQIRVTDGGTGSLNLPADFKKVSGGDGKEGTYENSAFSKSTSPIKITIDMSTGSVNIR